MWYQTYDTKRELHAIAAIHGAGSNTAVDYSNPSNAVDYTSISTVLEDLSVFSSTVIDIHDLVHVSSNLDGGASSTYVLGLGTSHLMVVEYSGQTWEDTWYATVSMADGSAVPTGM